MPLVTSLPWVSLSQPIWNRLGVRAEAGALVARALPGQPGSLPFGSVTLGLSCHICKMGLTKLL